jgi:hypothetical protein
MRCDASLALLFLLGSVVGCGNTGPGADAGADAPPERCEVDMVCPEEAPLAGGPCMGTLSCPYYRCGGPPFGDTYVCNAGQWMLESSMCLGVPPTLAELCRTPQTTGLEGARFVLTPDAAGATPYTDGQRVELVIGPQGGAMIPYRVRVEGLDATPTCIRATARVTSDGRTADDTKQLRLRCGSTLRVYEILPLCPLPGDHEITLEVTVEGIGTQTVRLIGTNTTACPR